jgi:hypothetical protein
VITAPKTAAAQRPEREIPLAKQPVYEGKAHEGYPLLIEHCGGLTPFSHCSLTKPIRAMPIIQPNPHSTLIVGIEELRKEGFTHDFNQCEYHLECKKLKKIFKPANLTITHAYRFEGMSSAGDNSVLYAIKADDGTKGILIDAYGVYANAISPEMIEKFRVEYDSPDEP